VGRNPVLILVKYSTLESKDGNYKSSNVNKQEKLIQSPCPMIHFKCLDMIGDGVKM
jgi:hypothetical protein